MIGQGHTENLSIFFLAIDILKNLSVKISDDAIKKSAEKTIMPARLEIIKKDNKRIILDGAHNIESCNNGADAIIAHHIKTPIKLLYTSMADKDYKSNLKILRKISDNVILTKLDMPRVASLDDLKQTAEQYNFKTEVIENPSSALNFAIHNMADDDTLLICGSFYLAGEMRKKLHNI
jgi:dihydrofolate synthase/folylpolyglutamate synthase